MWWRVLLLSLAYVLLSAHFMRYYGMLIALPVSLAPCLLLIKRKWVVSLLQVGLVAGTLLAWMPTMIQLTYTRIHFGQDWVRLMCILGAVMTFTLLAAFLANKLKNIAKTFE